MASVTPDDADGAGAEGAVATTEGAGAALVGSALRCCSTRRSIFDRAELYSASRISAFSVMVITRASTGATPSIRTAAMAAEQVARAALDDELLLTGFAAWATILTGRRAATAERDTVDLRAMFGFGGGDLGSRGWR